MREAGRMGLYIDDQESISRVAGGQAELVLEAIAGRFIGAHPKLPPVYRVHSTRGFYRRSDYRYEMNLLDKWPGTVDGQFVYVWGRLWSEQEAELPFSISCFGPAVVYVNGTRAFASNLNDDVFPDRKAYFRSKVRKGWNHIVLEFVKTGTGCGGIFGTGSVKGFPMHILAPTHDREGQEGWAYSGPLNDRLEALPGEDHAGKLQIRGGTAANEHDPEKAYSPEQITESDAAAASPDWYPRLSRPDAAEEKGCFDHLFGKLAGSTAFAWAKLEQLSPAPACVKLQGSYNGAFRLFVNGSLVYDSEGTSGELALSLELPFGLHDLLVQSDCSEETWGFKLKTAPASEPAAGSQPAVLTKPFAVEGTEGPWLYLGPFEAEQAPSPAEVMHIHPVRDELKPVSSAYCWRAELQDSWVRPYLESSMFGKWNYPLGVTLYGILKTGTALSNTRYVSYALDHIEQCTSLYAHSMWEASYFGSPGFNHQLAIIDSLDDCGSFGAAMLEANKARRLKGAEEAASSIARYITEEQSRLEDGTLYRASGTTDFMQDTIWCDDLYMSTPFLTKYYELTGESLYLDDAAEQFLHYKKRLFMPDLQIMHHVYDYKFNKPNGVPWGRGNGWVIFSLSELLAVMPPEHKRYDELLSFFRELCEGYVQLQGAEGLWHQVLTDPESYGEASCTSMFMYAFARGVRFGWLPESARYVQAVFRGWDGLTRHCIDKQGNVFGVCRGSGYSYSALYYKDELTWQLNDTHGIGIVLLAGIEMLQLRDHLMAKK